MSIRQLQWPIRTKLDSKCATHGTAKGCHASSSPRETWEWTSKFGPWRNPVQKQRCQRYKQAMHRAAMLPLTSQERVYLVKLLLPNATYGTDVGGCSQSRLNRLKVLTRRGTVRGDAHANKRCAKDVDIFTWGGSKLIPEVNIGEQTLKTWMTVIQQQGTTWPPNTTEWSRTQTTKRGRGSLRNLNSLVLPLDWQPSAEGWLTTSGPIAWEEVRHLAPDLLQNKQWEQLAERRTTFQDIEAGLDMSSIERLHTAGKSSCRQQQATLPAIGGGWWFGDRRQRVFEDAATCPFRGHSQDVGTTFSMNVREGASTTATPPCRGFARDRTSRTGAM